MLSAHLTQAKGAISSLRSEAETGRTPFLEAVAKRGYPTSEVGAGAESARLRQRRNGQEELPHVQSQGWRPGGATLRLRPGAVPESRGGGQKEQPHARGQGGYWEEQPHAQGVVAARAQEGLEEPSHVEGQEGWQ